MSTPNTVVRTPFQKWQDTIDQSTDDNRWHEHNELIERIVLEFNVRLSATKTQYRNLDSDLVKAMVWVESGGPDNAAWSKRPMQIGNPGDSGLAALLTGKEGGDLILTSAQKIVLQRGVGTPELNIQAGVAYLLMRSMRSEFKSVNDAMDTKVYEVTVKPGDSLDKIAHANGTTVAVLRALNPTAGGLIKPGQTLKLQKAAVQRVITGWVPINSEFAAKAYNVGDPLYRQKLDYCLGLITK